MIKIEKTEVVGWEPAIRGMRNPKNSWDRIDSSTCEHSTVIEHCSDCQHIDFCHADEGDIATKYIIGPNDHKLMMNLAKGGPVHAKYRRMIVVYVDITAPLYWWKEFDTYKVGTVANSCSTMHKIDAKEFTREDFSCEKLMDNDYIHEPDDSLVTLPMHVLDITISTLNYYREKFIEADKRLKDYIESLGGGNGIAVDELRHLKETKKKYWEQLIQLLPSSYNQKRTIMLNYEVLAGIYPMRRNHKLDEWHDFCRWIESLPYSEIMIPEMYSDEEMPSPDEEMDAWFKEHGNCTGCKYAEDATTADHCFGCIRIFGNVNGKDLFEHGDPDWEDK